LRDRVLNSAPGKIFDVDLNYITSRGRWYHISWKGDVSKSGGIATNIGIHFFDMLIWVFGAVKSLVVNTLQADCASGYLELERARVRWNLSINADHLPPAVRNQGKRTFRTLTMNGESIEFSDGFTELHTRSYESIIKGEGFGLTDARPSIELVHQIRNYKTSS
jgi:UDP-N-acetyl-2-amino-2-deoxyglucuronate dehydrogenase